jgi:glycine/D-amino acid oxidase-like deaminating enzyme
MGASVAYHLAAAGCRNILILERHDRPGLGSTGAATGGFRTQFGSAINVRLSLLAREKLLRFRDELGVDPGYRPCGYLFMARNEAEIAPLRRALAVQQAAGVREAREVTADDIRRLTPWVRADDLLGGTFCPLDGFIRPLEILRGYLGAAERLGARIRYGTGWIEVIVEESRPGAARRVMGVRSAEGMVATRCVVNAAGAWAGVVGARAGIEIPVRPVRRQTAITLPFPGLPEDIPMTICHWDGVHLRVRDGRVLLLWPVDLPSDDPFDTTFDPRWLSGLLPRVHDRFPLLAEAEIDLEHCWAGLYEMSPDRHALLGPAPGLEGLYLINGSSGHGVMHAPALGQLLAEIITGRRARALDVDALRPSRFDEGRPNPVDAVL